MQTTQHTTSSNNTDKINVVHKMLMRNYIRATLTVRTTTMTVIASTRMTISVQVGNLVIQQYKIKHTLVHSSHRYRVRVVFYYTDHLDVAKVH